MAKLNFKSAKDVAPTPTLNLTDVENWKIDQIKPYARNAKKHPPEQIKLLAKLVERHGFDQPIVVDTQGVIIKGHGRWLAMKSLGRATIPVIVSKLTPEEARAARLADNRSAEFGWQYDALIADMVTGLTRGIDVDHTGFTLKELGLDNSENVDDIAQKLSVETYQEDDESEDEKPTLKGKQADMIIIDDPLTGDVVPMADEETIKCPRCAHPVTA